MKIKTSILKKKVAKYRNKITEVHGIKFHSKAESKRYLHLEILRREKEISHFLRQVPFHLPGGVKYICDFLVFWTNGDVTIEDVKGYKTPTYIMKKKLVESIYPIKITEIS